MTEFNKNRVEQCFRKSMNTYDGQALVQDRICEHLVAMLAGHSTGHFPQVTEIGAGTGLLTARLLDRYVINKLYVNDLVAEMRAPLAAICEARSFNNAHFLMGDAELLELPVGNDLAVSASTFQWFTQLDLFFGNVSRSLVPGGFFAFSTFGPDNLREVCRITQSGLHYPSLPDLRAIAGNYFEIVEVRDEEETMYFESPLDVLRHMKQTGVNGLVPTVWTKQRLVDFTASYRSLFFTERGVSLTYNPVYFICSNTLHL